MQPVRQVRTIERIKSSTAGRMLGLYLRLIMHESTGDVVFATGQIVSEWVDFTNAKSLPSVGALAEGLSHTKKFDVC